MENFVQVNKTILVAEDKLSFYETNNFTPLFDLADGINTKIGIINTMVDKVTQNQVGRIDSLQTEEKEKWYTDFLHDLTQTNQALYGVMVMLDEKIAKQK